MAKTQMIKAGMNNKQMKRIAQSPAMRNASTEGMMNMQKKKTAKKQTNIQGQQQARYNEENRNVGLKKKKAEKKWTAAQDEAYDRKHGIKEGSKRDIKLDQERGVKDKKKKSAPMIKPSHRGLLHRKLGVPQGQKIPESQLNRAAHSKSPKLREEANFARNFGK